MSAFLLALLQAAATPAAAPPVPQRFSILTDPCASHRSVTNDDIVVCGNAAAIQPRLPLPRFRGPPDKAGPSNPDMSAAVALDGRGIGTECGAYAEACPEFANGQALPAIVNGAVGLVKDAFRKKPDKRGRVAIPLDDPVPAPVQP